jgi:hypothetical protein
VLYHDQRGETFEHGRLDKTALAGSEFLEDPAMTAMVRCSLCSVCQIRADLFEDTKRRDVDDRQSIAKSVLGVSEAQMLLARRILKGDNLTTASETPSININSQTSLVRTLLSVG